MEARPTVNLQLGSWAKNNPASLCSFLLGSHWSPALTESSWKPSAGQQKLTSQGSEKGGPRSRRMNGRYPAHWCIPRLRFLHFPSLQPTQRIHLKLISHTRVQNTIEQQLVGHYNTKITKCVVELIAFYLNVCSDSYCSLAYFPHWATYRINLIPAQE